MEAASAISAEVRGIRMGYYNFKDNELGKISEKKDKRKKVTLAVVGCSILAFIIYIILIRLAVKFNSSVFVTLIFVLWSSFVILFLRYRKFFVANEVSEREEILCSLAYGIRDLQDYASQRKDESFDAAKKSLGAALKLLKTAEIDGIGTKWEKNYNLFLDSLSQDLSILVKTKLRKGANTLELNPLIQGLITMFDGLEKDDPPTLAREVSSEKREKKELLGSKWKTRVKDFSVTVGIVISLGLLGVLSYLVVVYFFEQLNFNFSLAVTIFLGTPPSLMAVWGSLQNLREKRSKDRKE